MSQHLGTDDVHRFVDGQLRPERQWEVERHLDSCDACRAWVRQIRSLTAGLGRLREPVSPPHDLWPGVEARVRRPSEGGPHASRARIAAAAAILVLLSVALVLGRARIRTPPIAGAMSLPPAATTLEATYLPIVERLRRLSAARAARLAPDLGARVREDLAATDRAVSDAREALRRHPDDLELLTELSRSYRREVEALEWVIRVTPEGAP
jgi:anti-sigma factor RsiW